MIKRLMAAAFAAAFFMPAAGRALPMRSDQLSVSNYKFLGEVLRSHGIRTEARRRCHSDVGVLGLYDPRTNTLCVRYGADDSTLVHEIVHAIHDCASRGGLQSPGMISIFTALEDRPAEQRAFRDFIVKLHRRKGVSHNTHVKDATRRLSAQGAAIELEAYALQHAPLTVARLFDLFCVDNY